MKLLKDILPKNTRLIQGNWDAPVRGLSMDSREISASCNLFVAIIGTISDGHSFIDKAVAQGADIIICENVPNHIPPDISLIQVESSSETLGLIASAYCDHPSREMEVIGITGTNGKTTVSSLLHQLFTQLGEHCGLLSTVEYIVGTERKVSTHTTPDAVRLQHMLREMVDDGCSYCFMEVSSHAIDQHRISGLHFAGAIFTNITHDHLDYHKTFKNYLYTKKRLFDELPTGSWALVNKDDKNSSVIAQGSDAPVYKYALKRSADFKARILEHDFGGMLLQINDKEAWFKLVGEFNAYNILAVYATAFLCDFDTDEIITQMTRLESVQGRFQYFKSPENIIGIVDYAHTPDALENVLSTINNIRSKNEELITVVGCGGDRDREKRPVMARVACQLSTKVILTSDNPRNEDPKEILKEMQNGVLPQDYKKTLTIEDRENAIRTAISIANPGDIILIAGKGHETYQEIKGERFPFDDREVFIQNTKNN